MESIICFHCICIEDVKCPPLCLIIFTSHISCVLILLYYWQYKSFWLDFVSCSAIITCPKLNSLLSILYTLPSPCSYHSQPDFSLQWITLSRICCWHKSTKILDEPYFLHFLHFSISINTHIYFLTFSPFFLILILIIPQLDYGSQHASIDFLH